MQHFVYENWDVRREIEDKDALKVVQAEHFDVLLE